MSDAMDINRRGTPDMGAWHNDRLTIAVTNDGWLRVSGALDLDTAPQLRSAVERHALPDRPVVVDLSGITFCDSTGLSSLIWAHHHDAVLANPSVHLQRLLSLTGLSEYLPMASF